MKIRNGFVSNSSSSSFLMLRKNSFIHKHSKRIITAKEEKILTKFGFKKVSCFRSDQVPDLSCDLNIEKNDIENYSLGYRVDCNQDDVIYFLLKNNIPFEATCRYGDETIIYLKGEKNFLIFQNYGNRFSGYYDEKSYDGICDGIEDKPPLQKIDVKNWLKKEEKYQTPLLNI